MSLSAAPYGTMLTAMATAFSDDGSVDLDGTAAIADHLIRHGNDGVVVSGTTGESPTTTVAEDGEILRAVKDAVGDRGTVIAGVGTNATAHSIELARQAEKVGVDAVLLVTPYYNKPGPAGALHHFTQVAQTTDLPVMLYDVPGRTGQAIALETYEAARRLDTVTSVKHATGNPTDTIALRELGRDGLAELVARTSRHATALATAIGGLPGAELVAVSGLNQALVRFLDPDPVASPADHDARTDAVIAAINATGEALFGGVTWRGRRCMRISVCNWRTDEADVARAVEAVRRGLLQNS